MPWWANIEVDVGAAVRHQARHMPGGGEQLQRPVADGEVEAWVTDHGHILARAARQRQPADTHAVAILRGRT